ncbi:MAG: signal peptide peptidase SppA [Leptospiraceae bacterium]|nr:signal peptide peptidase SppA [Leptospiraceae bacterium]
MQSNRSIISFILILCIISIGLSLFQIIKKSPGNNQQVNTQGLFNDIKESAILIKIEGEIHSGKSTYSSTGADTILAKLRDINSKENIKGVLIEINSPGGTVAASQEIYEELMKLREKKKIVVSMKDLAASGGYYIAAGANHIFAESGTITGSIGVIAMNPNISGLLERYNVKMNVYKQGKYKDILSMFRDPTEEELSLIQNLLSDTYNKFVSDVSKGRNLSLKEVDKIAQGRIFSGTAAVKNKLVDGIGGRAEALKKLSDLCEFNGILPLQEEEETPFDRFFEILNTKVNKIKIFGEPENLVFEKIYKNPVLLILPNAVRF